MSADQTINLRVEARAILGEAQKQIGEFLQKVEGAADATKKKSLSLGDMAKAASIAAGAITGLAAGLATMGAKGADIADLRDSFAHLNKTMGNDSTAVLKELKESFAGTRTDADLMRMANQALQSGLKASTKDFGLIADAARVLSDRTGVDAADAFKALSQAMATGKTKAAELLVGVIDNTAAINRYAVENGKSVKNLTEHEKIEAVAIATKRKLEEVVASNGKAQVDFADKVDQSKVKIGNMVDGINEWIATKPELGTYASIVTGVAGSFTLLGAAAVPVTGLFKTLGTTMGVAGLGKSMAGAIGGFAGLKAAAAAAAIPLGAVAAAIASVWGAWKIGNIESVKNGIAEWALSANNVTAHVFRWAAGVERLTPEQAKLAVQSTAAAEAARKQADAQKGVTNASEDLTSELKKVMDAAREEAEQAMADAKALADNEAATKKAAKAKEDLAAGYAKVRSEVMNEEGLARMKEDAQMMQDVADAMSAGSIKISGVKVDAEGWRKELRGFETIVKNDMSVVGAIIPPALTPPPTQWDSFFGDLSKTIRKGFGPTILAAFTGGGDVGKAIGSFLGGSITEGLFGKKGGIGDKLMGKVSGLFGKSGMGKWMGDAISSFLPGIGGLLTSFIGPLVGKLGGMIKDMFGGPSAKEMAGRGVVAEFKADLDASLTSAQKLEAGTEAWKRQVVAIRDAYITVGRTEQEALDVSARLWEAEKRGPDAVKAVIAEISTALLDNYVPDGQEAHGIATLGWSGVMDIINKSKDATTAAGDEATTYGDKTEAASLIGKSSIEAMRDEVQLLKSKLGDRKEIDDLERALDEASKEGVGDLAWMTDKIALLKDEIGKPITIDVIMRQVNELPAELTSASGEHTVSSGWQLRPGQTWEEALQEFLVKNPGDEHRFLGAMKDEHRIDEAMTNTPGVFHGGGMIRAHRGMYLGADEVPIIAQTGEGILSRRGMAALGGPGALDALNSGQCTTNNTTVVVVVDQNGARRGTAGDVPDALLRRIQEWAQAGLIPIPQRAISARAW
jgi:hypothetical protein